MMLCKRYQQRGIGLLELMLGLTIIAVVIVMATRYYSSTKVSQNANQTVQDLASIVSAAEKWTIGNPNKGFDEMALEDLVELKLLPPHLNIETPRNPFGQPYEIINPIGSKHQFVITFDVSEKECAAVANLLKSQQSNRLFDSGIDPCETGIARIVYTSGN